MSVDRCIVHFADARQSGSSMKVATEIRNPPR